MVGLWFFYGGLRWINGALRWWICNQQWVSVFFFFFILRGTKHRKIFSEPFSKMQTNTVKTNIFL
jgi:hypothetical protein